MWKVKRMNTARIAVLTIAIGAGGIAAWLASGSEKTEAPAAPVAQLPTVDVLVTKSEIGLGQTVKAEDLQWQSWPTASAGNFISGLPGAWNVLFCISRSNAVCLPFTIA